MRVVFTGNQNAVAYLFNTLLVTTAFESTGDVLVHMHNILSNISKE